MNGARRRFEPQGKKTRQLKRPQAGFSMLYVIAVLVAVGTLAAGMVVFVDTTVNSQLKQTYTEQARYLALAGFNYARNFREDYDFLDDKTFTFPGVGSISYSDYRQTTDEKIEIRVEATVLAGTAMETNAVIFQQFTSQSQGAITFKDNMDDFDGESNTSDPSKNPVVIDMPNKTFTIGANQYTAFGSMYYTGTKTFNWGDNVCVDGECTFNEGFRMFFVSDYGSGSAADGIVFTWFGAAGTSDNSIYSIGGDSQHGEMIGYAADGRVYENGSYGSGIVKWFADAEANGIQPPKMGVEFDNYHNGGTGAICNVNPYTGPRTSQRRDGVNSDHIAFMFWGSDEITTGQRSASSWNTSGDTYENGFNCAHLRTSNGSSIGSMSSKSRAFDNDLTENTWNSAYRNNKAGTIGKKWSEKKHVYGFRISGSSNEGFASGGSESVTLTLRGSNTNKYSAATQLGQVSITDTDGTSYQYVVDDPEAVDSYRYHWVKVKDNSATRVYVAELEFMGGGEYYTEKQPHFLNDALSGKTVSSANYAGIITYDDNVHGHGDNMANDVDWHAGNFVNISPFAFRLEVERPTTANGSGNYDYKLRAWVKECSTTDCIEYVERTGSGDERNKAFFSDTSKFLCYDTTEQPRCSVETAPILEQSVELTATEHDNFADFIFGFTEATGGSTQTATYSHFILQFNKSNDYETVSGDLQHRRVINYAIY